MAKKNNPKAEKAKRNLEYARLHKKRARPARGFNRGPRPPAPPSVGGVGGEGAAAPAAPRV